MDGACSLSTILDGDGVLDIASRVSGWAESGRRLSIAFTRSDKAAKSRAKFSACWSRPVRKQSFYEHVGDGPRASYGVVTIGKDEGGEEAHVYCRRCMCTRRHTLSHRHVSVIDEWSPNIVITRSSPAYLAIAFPEQTVRVAIDLHMDVLSFETPAPKEIVHAALERSEYGDA